MKKLHEPAIAYYSQPQIMELKRQLITSIEKENDVEVLHKYALIMQQKQAEDYMPYCFTEEQLSDFIKESEESGWADEEEVKAFEEKWLNLK